MAAEEQHQVVSLSAAATYGLEYHNDDTSSSRIERMVNNQFLSDITFVVGPDKQRIYAHKLHLVTVSEYFFTLFYGNFSESKRDEIELKDEDPEIFLTMLRLIYGAKVEIDYENLRDIYQHIQMYLLPNEYCKPLINFLVDQIVDKDTAMNVFRENEHYKFLLVDEACMLYIQSDPIYYFKKYDFTTLEQESLRKIVCLQKVNCIEEQLLDVIEKWELANPESDTKELRELLKGTTRDLYSRKWRMFRNEELHLLTNVCEEFSLTLAFPKLLSLYGIGIYLWPTDDSDVTVTLSVLDSNVYTEICHVKVVERRKTRPMILDLMFEEMVMVGDKSIDFHLSMKNINNFVGLNLNSVRDLITYDNIIFSYHNFSYQGYVHAMAHLWIKDPKMRHGSK